MKTVSLACEKNGPVRIKDVRCPHCRGILRGYAAMLARNHGAFRWHHKENTMGKYHTITVLDADLIRKAAVLLDEWDKTTTRSVMFDSFLERIFVKDDMGHTIKSEPY